MLKAIFTLAKLSEIMPAITTSDSDTLVLALATLDSKTKNRNDPICVALPKVAKASKALAQSHRRFCHKLCQCKCA